jgi:hypothetical protein
VMFAAACQQMPAGTKTSVMPACHGDPRARERDIYIYRERERYSSVYIYVQIGDLARRFACQSRNGGAHKLPTKPQRWSQESCRQSRNGGAEQGLAYQAVLQQQANMFPTLGSPRPCLCCHNKQAVSQNVLPQQAVNCVRDLMPHQPKPNAATRRRSQELPLAPRHHRRYPCDVCCEPANGCPLTLQLRVRPPAL